MLTRFLQSASKTGSGLQYVGGNSRSIAGSLGTTNTLSLTELTGGISSSAANGDLVIAAYAIGANSDRLLTITDGTSNYTLIGTELSSNGTGYDTNLRVAYKRLTAADATVSFGPTGSTNNAGAAVVHVWRGANAATPLDVTPTTATGTSTGRPDPPSITPVTAGSKIIIVGASSASVTSPFVANYLLNLIQITSASTYDAAVAIGSVDWTSGAYNGAQFTGGTTNSLDSWAALAFAIRPE